MFFFFSIIFTRISSFTNQNFHWLRKANILQRAVQRLQSGYQSDNLVENTPSIQKTIYEIISWP